MKIWTKRKLCVSICQPGGTFSFSVRTIIYLMNSCLFLTTILSVWLEYWKLMRFLEVAFCEEKRVCDLINMHLDLVDLLSNWANQRQLLELGAWVELGVQSPQVWDQGRTTSWAREASGVWAGQAYPLVVLLRAESARSCGQLCIVRAHWLLWDFFSVKSQFYKELRVHKAPAGISSVGMGGFSPHRAGVQCPTKALRSGRRCAVKECAKQYDKMMC